MGPAWTDRKPTTPTLCQSTRYTPPHNLHPTPLLYTCHHITPLSHTVFTTSHCTPHLASPYGTARYTSQTTLHSLRDSTTPHYASLFTIHITLLSLNTPPHHTVLPCSQSASRYCPSTFHHTGRLLTTRYFLPHISYYIALLCAHSTVPRSTSIHKLYTMLHFPSLSSTLHLLPVYAVHLTLHSSSRHTTWHSPLFHPINRLVQVGWWDREEN